MLLTFSNVNLENLYIAVVAYLVSGGCRGSPDIVISVLHIALIIPCVYYANKNNENKIVFCFPGKLNSNQGPWPDPLVRFSRRLFNPIYPSLFQHTPQAPSSCLSSMHVGLSFLCKFPVFGR
jgi:hypothetical protein